MTFWVAGAVVVGSAVNAYTSRDAARRQSNAADNAAQMQWDQYQQTREDQTPWRTAGANALSQIGANQDYFNHQFNAQDLQSSLAPNYQFQLQQGLGATQNLANASGGLIGGNALKGINDYAQNFAGNAYQQAFNNYTAQQSNIYNRLSNLAGLGQTANQATNNAGMTAAGNAGNFLTSGAAAQAAGQIGTGNAINNGISNYMGWNYLSSSPRNTGIYGSNGTPQAGP